MKKYFFILLFSFIYLDCSDNTLSPIEEKNFREIAYTSLTEQEKESIVSDWKEAPVIIGKYQKSGDSHVFLSDDDIKWHFVILDSSIVPVENQNLVAVTFNTKDDSLLGPITVIINPRINKAIGGVLRF